MRGTRKREKIAPSGARILHHGPQIGEEIKSLTIGNFTVRTLLSNE